MIEASADDLKQAVEGLHDCRATLREVVPVTEEFQGQTVWKGIVHVFDIEDHPTAKVCYAWSSYIDDSERRKFYAVLGVPPINAPIEAVRAAVVSDTRNDHASSS